VAKTAILYIDLLGVQRMWMQGGAYAVKNRVEEFHEFVTEQLEWLSHDLHRDGEYTAILSGDSVAVTCQDFDQAIGIGIHLFSQAFYASDRTSSPFWFRGAISRWSNQYLTVNTVPITAKGLQIGTRYVTEDQFLAALALEKSGYRGMRLIVDSSLLQDHGRCHTRQWEGLRRELRIITPLKDCPYPDGRDFADVLWMADRPDRLDDLNGIMTKRFKRATRDPHEFVQASWTRVVFDQVNTLVWLCKTYGYSTESPASPAGPADDATGELAPASAAPEELGTTNQVDDSPTARMPDSGAAGTPLPQ
jgi:hypothetical protein